MSALPENGQLEVTPLPRLLLDVHRSRFTGALRLSRERLEKTFLFNDGSPIFAESNLASESLGIQLMDRGRISRADYSRVVAHVEREGCKEGKALLDHEIPECIPRQWVHTVPGQAFVAGQQCGIGGPCPPVGGNHHTQVLSPETLLLGSMKEPVEADLGGQPLGIC